MQGMRKVNHSIADAINGLGDADDTGVEHSSGMTTILDVLLDF
jgi:hypothetical protein